jgi:uncharacterized protein YerC
MPPTVFAAIVATFMSTDTTGRCNDTGVLPLLKRHEIQVLLKVGLSQADIAQRTGVSVDTVGRVADEADVTHINDHARTSRAWHRPPR